MKVETVFFFSIFESAKFILLEIIDQTYQEIVCDALHNRHSTLLAGMFVLELFKPECELFCSVQKLAETDTLELLLACQAARTN
jgi:hypothetical protein